MLSTLFSPFISIIFLVSILYLVVLGFSNPFVKIVRFAAIFSKSSASEIAYSPFPIIATFLFL